MYLESCIYIALLCENDGKAKINIQVLRFLTENRVRPGDTAGCQEEEEEEEDAH